jgi:hypothetical protein
VADEKKKMPRQDGFSSLKVLCSPSSVKVCIGSKMPAYRASKVHVLPKIL